MIKSVSRPGHSFIKTSLHFAGLLLHKLRGREEWEGDGRMRLYRLEEVKLPEVVDLS